MMKRIISIVLLILIISSAISFGEKILNNKIPIIFSEYYDITLFGLQKLHPFDTEKYGKIYAYIINQMGFDKDRFYTPEQVTEEDLLSVHTKEYLTSLNKSKNIAIIAELGLLAILPNFILQKKLLKPMKYATGGTILGVNLAKQYGWAINLSGGYHHAKAESGGGFCFFADIAIAVYKLLIKNKNMSVMIIDLDAHQGNGYASIFKDNQQIHIFDLYNSDIYPKDSEAQKFIEFDLPVTSLIDDLQYISLLEKELPEAIKKSKPDIIIYNAGTDLFEEDPLGNMDISEKGIIKRDEIVFKKALQNKIPILMVLSGGYTQKSAEITGKSIVNILKNVI